MAKKILQILFALFLAWRSYELLTHLVVWGYGFWEGLIYTALLSLFVTGVSAFLVFSLPVERLLPKAYYHIHHASRLKKVGGMMKVEAFRTFLLLTFWRNKARQLTFFDGSSSGLKSFERETRKSEFGHLIPGVFLFICCVHLLLHGRLYMVLHLSWINLIFNVYPVLLQRMHRERIKRITLALKSRTSRNG